MYACVEKVSFVFTLNVTLTCFVQEHAVTDEQRTNFTDSGLTNDINNNNDEE